MYKVFNCDLTDYVFLSFFQLALFHKQTFHFAIGWNVIFYLILLSSAFALAVKIKN